MAYPWRGRQQRREEALPVPVGLAVVREVADVGEEGGLRMACECLCEQLCEGLVRFAALRVVDEQCLEGRELGRRRIDRQRDGLIGHGDRALVRRCGRQAREAHGVERRRRIVLHECVCLWYIVLR